MNIRSLIFALAAGASAFVSPGPKPTFSPFKTNFKMDDAAAAAVIVEHNQDYHATVAAQATGNDASGGLRLEAPPTEDKAKPTSKEVRIDMTAHIMSRMADVKKLGEEYHLLLQADPFGEKTEKAQQKYMEYSRQLQDDKNLLRKAQLRTFDDRDEVARWAKLMRKAAQAQGLDTIPIEEIYILDFLLTKEGLVVAMMDSESRTGVYLYSVDAGEILR
jgi:hypothetical protein